MIARLAVASLVAALAPAPAAQAAPSASAGQAQAIRAALSPAPFFTEVFAPARAPEGVAITLHKGAWNATGPAAAASEHGDDHAWLRRRWLAVNSSYRPGTAGLADVRWVYARVVRATHRLLPVCLVGASSGGNLALTAAVTLPSLDCVVAEAAPTDLVHIGSQTAYDGSSAGPAHIRDAAVAALGEANLGAFSPLFGAARVRARVLLAEAAQDPLIPHRQLGDLCTRLRSRCAGDLRLGPGPLWFVHAGVGRAPLSAFRSAETRLAHQVVAAFGR